MFNRTRHKWLPADGCKGKGGEREEQRVKECSHRVRKVEKKSVTSTRLIQTFKWQHPLKCTLQLPLIWPWLDISTRETFRYSVYFSRWILQAVSLVWTSCGRNCYRNMKTFLGIIRRVSWQAAVGAHIKSLNCLAARLYWSTLGL